MNSSLGIQKYDLKPMFNTDKEFEYLISNLNKDQVVLEWGSGGSTIEIAKHVKQLYSIEHDIHWFLKVKRRIPANVIYQLVQRNQKEKPGHDGTLEDYFDYVNFPKSLNKKFDVIFIDGRARVDCAKIAVNLLNKGGFILIHDIFNPDPKCDRPEYYEVLNFLNRIKGVYSLYKFKPK